MGITHPVASAANFANTSGTQVSASITPAVGDLIAVGGLANAGGTLSIADSDGNTWFTANPLFTNNAGLDVLQSWYCFAKSAVSTTITITASNTNTFRVVLVDIFRGTDQSSRVLGPKISTVATTGSPLSGAIVLDADDCAVWAWCADSITAVGNIDGAAATKGADDTQQDWSEYALLSGRNGASVTASFTGASGTFSIGVVAWRPPIPYVASQPFAITQRLG